jgi:formate C-acetyltransferase
MPKYGNDDDYVDEEVAWVMHEFVSEFKMMRNMRGGYGCPGGSPMHQYVPLGKTVGALPSGRQAWEPLADSASPSAGKDVNGPTSVFKSVGKIDNIEILGGVILNMRVDPSVFEGGSVQRMAGLIRAFIDQKIYHVQVNVVSTDTLKAAQKEPEKYRDLMVKVAGYNAFFTQLGKEHQDPIIARTAHGI